MDRKEDGHRIRSRTKWMKSKYRMNKYLFSSIKERPTRGLITKVYDDDDDTVVFLSADLARVCNFLYSKLYTKSTPDEQRRECCVELLRYVSSVISLMAQTVWEAPIMKEELTNTIQALAKGKSPRPNGLTADFFKAYWSFMNANFTSMVHISFAHSRFPRGVTHGLITLLFRDGDQLRLINWQPTVLHNHAFKFFAKASKCAFTHC